MSSRSFRRTLSAASSATGVSANRIAVQTSRANIQAGSSKQRPERSSVREQRRTSSPPFLVTSWMQTIRPNHGCQGYTTSRSSVPWAFCRLVLQRPAAAHEPAWAHPQRVCSPVQDGPQPERTLAMNEGTKGAGSVVQPTMTAASYPTLTTHPSRSPIRPSPTTETLDLCLTMGTIKVRSSFIFDARQADRKSSDFSSLPPLR